MTILLADLMLRPTILIGLAALIACGLRRRNVAPSLRHALWLGVIIGTLISPLLYLCLPRVHIPILNDPGGVRATLTSGNRFASADAGHDWLNGFLAIYAAGALAMLARLIFGQFRLGTLWRSAGAANRVVPNGVAAAMTELRVALRTSDRSTVAMTWGAFSPKIVVPTEALEWPEAKWRYVLQHELAHVRRRDSVAQTLASFACALYWLNPAIWFAACELRLEQEQAADEIVVRGGANAHSYASSLLEIAKSLRSPPRAIVAPVVSARRELERRLVGLAHLSSTDPAPSGGRVCVLGGATLAVAAALSLPVSVLAEPAKALVYRPSGEASTISRTALGSAPPEARGPYDGPRGLPVNRPRASVAAQRIHRSRNIGGPQHAPSPLLAGLGPVATAHRGPRLGGQVVQFPPSRTWLPVPLQAPLSPEGAPPPPT